MKKQQNNLEKEIENKYRLCIEGFHLKKYLHFDKEFCSDNPEKILKLTGYIKDHKMIASHSFMPLIGSTSIERRISRKKTYWYYKKMLENNLDNNEIASVCRKQIESFEENGVKKERALAYASHLDSHIYSYYAAMLKPLYEMAIANTPLENEVIAYRKIKNLTRNGVKSKFTSTVAAYDAIDAIKKFDNNCYALCFDLEHFFDTIEHQHLKDAWCSILGKDKLPEDHYNIFKSVTRFCYVKTEEIEHIFNLEREKADRTGNEIKSIHGFFKNAKDFRRFRKTYAKAYPDHPAFHQNPGLNKEGLPLHGIPQGLSISTVLSNIYMLPFDRTVSEFVHQHGGFYRRYCDDIMIIIPHNEELKDETVTLLKKAVAERGDSLKLHPIHEWDKHTKSQCFDFLDKEKLMRKPLQYLGITYDGKNVRIRQSSISKYQRNQAKAVSANLMKVKHILMHNYNEKKSISCLKRSDVCIRRTSLYESFTFRGNQNFYGYASTVAKMFDSEAVRSQLRSHCTRFSKLIDEANKNLRSIIARFLVKKHRDKLMPNEFLLSLETEEEQS